MTNTTTDIKTDKITVNGVPPKWDDAEFESRVAGWIQVYHNTTQSMTYVTAPLSYDFLELVSAKTAEGHRIARNQLISFEALKYGCWMIKPEATQAQDIAEIRVNEKTKYVEFLESERARYQDMLRQQLIQSAELKEQKKIEDAKAKRLAEIDKEVNELFKPLDIPA